FAYTLLVFFFQAEDGIRDRNVTGVQTCALPISSARKFPFPQAGSKKRLSIRSVSCFTRSHMAFTSRSAVKTSPWSTTRCLDFTCCRSEEHTSELQSRFDIVCRLLLET